MLESHVCTFHLQVRAKAKADAAQKREAYKKEEERQIEKIKIQTICEWEDERAEKLVKLEKAYENNVRNVGEGHVNAQDLVSEIVSFLSASLRI